MKKNYSPQITRLLAKIISYYPSRDYLNLFRDGGIPTPNGSFFSQENIENELYNKLTTALGDENVQGFEWVLDKVQRKSPTYFANPDKGEVPKMLFVELKSLLRISATKSTKYGRLDLFNLHRFHPRVVAVARELFVNKHYSQAILEACKALNNEVKNISRIDGSDGKDLMSKAFNLQSGKIKLTDCANQSATDEQEGLALIFMGTMQGIRNPKSHENINLKDATKALEYLSLVSLLFRRLDERQNSNL